MATSFHSQILMEGFANDLTQEVLWWEVSWLLGMLHANLEQKDLEAILRTMPESGSLT